MIPILFICLQKVRELDLLFEYSTRHLIILSNPPQGVRQLAQCLNTPHLTILWFLSHPLHPSPDCTWTCSIVWIPLVWSTYPIRHAPQGVRNLTQLMFEYPLSDHPIPSSSSVTVYRAYVNILNCLNPPQLIILYHLLHPSPGCRWTCSIVCLSSDYPIPSSCSVSRKYVNYSNCFKTSNLIPSSPDCEGMWTWSNYLNSHHLINLSHRLHPSPARTWTLAIGLRLLIWLSIPSSSSIGNHLVIPSHTCLSPACAWTSSILFRLLIWVLWLQPFSNRLPSPTSKLNDSDWINFVTV